MFHFGLPRNFRLASTCSWKAHSVSGEKKQTSHASSQSLSLLAFCTRSLIMQKESTFIGTDCHHRISSFYFTLFHRVLFTFPSRYLSLSVVHLYLGIGVVTQSGVTHIVLPSALHVCFTVNTGLSPSMASYSKLLPVVYWLPYPISLAATLGISIDFFSFRYLDVSVRWVFVQVCLCSHTRAHI